MSAPATGPGGTLRLDLSDAADGLCPDTGRPLPLRLVDVDDRILTLHGPVARAMNRFKRYVAAALIVLALGNAWQVKTGQDQARERRAQIIAAAVASDRQAWDACQARNANTRMLRRILNDLATDAAATPETRARIARIRIVDCGAEPAAETVRP